MLSSCIDRYYLDEIADTTPKLVVDASIVDTDEEQIIKISYSSTDEYPKFEGVGNCNVLIMDEAGNQFYASSDQSNIGYYKITFPDGFLTIGKKFQLLITTPDNNTYKSRFEELLPSPPIDSVYFSVEHHETSQIGNKIDGLQFYIDFEGTSYFGKYYRWVIEETYEYHSTWPIKDYLDVDGFHRPPIDFSKFICYKTENNNAIFLLSTNGLIENRYKKAKMHFVDDRSQRLMFNYSILIKQRSLSQQAYLYWENVKKNNQETAGLFTKQPAMPKGNIFNETDSTEVVLGYFTLSSETTKRIVIEDVPELLFNHYHFCTAIPFDGPLPLDPRPMYWVPYVLPDGTVTMGYTSDECVDCTFHGGVVDKPYFFK